MLLILVTLRSCLITDAFAMSVSDHNRLLCVYVILYIIEDLCACLSDCLCPEYALKPRNPAGPKIAETRR